MPFVRLLCGLAAAAVAVAGVRATEPTREQALRAIEQPESSVRLAGVERLAQIGLMTDADRLVGRLGDSDAQVRAAASEAMWRIWSRSGDPVVDALFAHGLQQMQASDYGGALSTFDEIVSRKPEFAEGWNKRATIYFLVGEDERSLKDCDEVLKRNPNPFGALSGAGQIHLRLGHPQHALEFFQRALQVNPNLDGIRQVIPLLEQHLRGKAGQTT